jgi:hypothetical protein
MVLMLAFKNRDIFILYFLGDHCSPPYAQILASPLPTSLAIQLG